MSLPNATITDSFKLINSFAWHSTYGYLHWSSHRSVWAGCCSEVRLAQGITRFGPGLAKTWRIGIKPGLAFSGRSPLLLLQGLPGTWHSLTLSSLDVHWSLDRIILITPPRISSHTDTSSFISITLSKRGKTNKRGTLTKQTNNKTIKEGGLGQ